MTKSPNQKLALEKSESWQMFNAISPKYDLLNHLLSFGLDIVWRKKLGRFLVLGENPKLLDLATGTGDVLLSLFEQHPYIESAIGIDMAEKMLEIGREKIKTKNLDNKITLQHGDANNIPFDENTFHNVTISFGIRNVEDPTQVMAEMYRVLNKGGRALILEFSLPKNIIMRILHIFYLRTIVPIVGWIISRHYKAYKYLNQTIESFPFGDQFCQLMRDKGFKNVKANELLFGVATIYQGDK